MSSNRLQPLLLDSTALPSLPDKWEWAQLENVTIAVSVGRKYDGKSVVPGGTVPVVDQSPSGVMGHHNDDPGVPASHDDPVFTFANHTCAMRWMTIPFSCIQNVFAFKGRSGVNTRYAYYAALGRVVLEEYKGHVPAFRSMFLPIATVHEQENIAALLSTLDDRITLLRETNVTLEAIAQALFKSWFVDFDPVRAKMEGRTPQGMDEAAAALFPDGFETSELGEVPRGWCWEPLANVFDFNPSRPLKKGVMASYLDMASLATSGHCADGPIAREMGSGSKFCNGDTLLARITPCLENGKSAFVDFLNEGEIGWGSTEFLVLRPKAPLPNYFAYLLCRHPTFREYAVRCMSGTSGRQRIQNDVLGRYLLAVGTAQVATAFGSIVEPIQSGRSQI